MKEAFYSHVLHAMALAGATVALLEIVRWKYRKKNNPRTVVENMKMIKMIKSPW